MELFIGTNMSNGDYPCHTVYVVYLRYKGENVNQLEFIKAGGSEM
jgi:hypothetical protein